jgi:glucose/arabinose dehydrogenase
MILRNFAVAASVIALGACAAAETRNVATEGGSIVVEEVAGDLDHPWGMAFLPDGRLLVTERAGALRILGKDRQLSPPLAGVPKALGRGRLAGNALEGFAVIFRQQPKVDGPNHFGGRIVFADDGALFLTTGERFKFDPAQELGSHLGKIVRIKPDGAAPDDNPFVGRNGNQAAIWSYGHRNVEAAAIHPESKALWVAEMGPQGGDELNLVERGKNYGWPLVSWGEHYNGKDIPDPPTRPELADAVKHWTPVISPSGMLFYTGAMFPRWRGNMFIGGLSTSGLVRLTFADGKPAVEERIPLGARIRDVEQAPDGSLYVLTDDDDGKVLRLSSVP